MSSKELIERLTEDVRDVPRSVAVLETRQRSIREHLDRTQEFLATISEAVGFSTERADWVERKDRTLVRLTEGARAAVYHASGTMVLNTGLDPMAAPFRRAQERDQLEELVAKQAERFGLARWAGEHGELHHERLWQIKAAAMDREGEVVEPMLFRVVGAFRHVVNELPVWGPASVALKLAGGGELDTVTVHVRETTGEAVDEVETLPPDVGARSIVSQLEALMGRADVSIDEVAKPQWMRFGYLSLSKRKDQRLLEPVYVAQIDIEAEEAQGYVLVSPASEKVYMPFGRQGLDPIARSDRREVQPFRPPGKR